MITLKIFNRRVKVRSFKDMTLSEYLALDGNPKVVEYLALQLNKDISELLTMEVNPLVLHRINDVDINSLNLKSIEYKGTYYTGFNAMPYGVHFLADVIFRENRDNQGLWIFAIALSFKVDEVFDIGKATIVYNDLLKMPAIDVAPIMNLFVRHYLKKKVFTIKNLLLFIKASPRVALVLIRDSWSFITRKFNYKRYQRYSGKS